MIRQRVSIMVKGKPWNITAFYPLTRYHVKEIIDTLYSIHCNREDLRKAYKNLTGGQMNNGLTFSNYALRETVTVFAKSTCPEQYFNLIIIRDIICEYVDLSLNLHHEEGDSYTKRR